MTAHTGAWRHFRHHLVVALVAASALTLLHHANLLNWLDSLTLRLVSNTHVVSSSRSTVAGPELPLVLLITDVAYEAEFAQASPLNRARLQQLISLAAAECPAVLAIDLDLSPGPNDAVLPDQAALDTTLQALGLPQPCAGNAGQPAPRLLLATPIPVATPSLVELKYQWMKRLCEAGVSFAFHDVVVSQGAVLRIDPGAPTLGVTAAEMVHGERAAGHVASQQIERPCDQIRRGKDSATFLRRSHLGELHAGAARFSAQRPFNAQFFAAEAASEGVNRVRHVITTSSALPSTVRPGELSGQTVFLGGSYGVGDRFATPFGPQPGVLVHAASYYSLVHPVRITNDLVAFAIEVLLGVLLGYYFHRGWASYGNAQVRLKSATRSRWFVPYLQARLWLLANFGMLFIAVAVVVLGAAVLFFPLNLWVNAGPIVLGVFVKALLASRGGQHENAEASHAPAPGHSTATEVADATESKAASPNEAVDGAQAGPVTPKSTAESLLPRPKTPTEAAAGSLPRPAAHVDAALAFALVLCSLALILFGSH